MRREGLTGSRIRERRSVAGMRQADLARALGISASYLNLIEHNRRRIGGKLLLNIAKELGVEASLLSEGAEAALIATLREAAKGANLPSSEVERADELAGRFPVWAEVLATGHRRIAALERTIETLSDRLSHDPKLASSVHELLSTAAAIRSTASILADEKDLDEQWRDRFHANLNEDSKRLAESSKSLVEYFEAGQVHADAAFAPQDEVDAFLAQENYDLDGLVTGEMSVDEVIAGSDVLRTTTAAKLAKTVLTRLRSDAAQVPVKALTAALKKIGPDPIALAAELQVPVAVVLRRMATRSDLQAGLVVCDRSGSILLRKPVGQMVIPQFGAACVLWPIFSALSQPGQVLHTSLVQLGRGQAYFECYAVAEVVGETHYNAPPLIEASMLLIASGPPETGAALEVGSTCGVCPKNNCPGRREPSILMDGI
ncbi:MAG: short-chain fatty acyl-CoA regulator family protein [Roseobacter sp.]